MSLIEDLKQIRETVGKYTSSSDAHLLVEGPDAPDYLQRMITNEITGLPVGKGCHNALLDRKGHVLSLFFLIRQKKDSFHLIIPQSLKEKTMELLLKFKVIEKFEIKDLKHDWSVTSLIGPQAETFLKNGAQATTWKEEIYGTPVLKILQLKKNKINFEEVPVVGETSLDILRMEVGVPKYGIDIDETRILLEANLHHTYKRHKGCYPGQEVVERILAYGNGRTPKQLCPLFIEDETLLPAGTDIFSASGAKAGKVTSSLYDPHKKRTIVLAYLESKFITENRNVRMKENRWTL